MNKIKLEIINDNEINPAFHARHDNRDKLTEKEVII